MAALHRNITHETSHAEWDFPQTYTHAQTFQPKIISPSSWFFLLFSFSFWNNLALPAEWHRSLLSICLWFSWQWHFMRHGWSGQVQKDSQEWDRHGSSSMSHEDRLYRSLGRHWEMSMWFMFLASSSPPVHLYAFLQRKKVNVPLKCPGNVLLISTISEESALYLRCCAMNATWSKIGIKALK